MEASLKPKKLTTFNILLFEIRYGLPVNFKVFSFLTIMVKWLVSFSFGSILRIDRSHEMLKSSQPPNEL